MNSRINFQTVLEDLLGSRQVYFQRPNSVRMDYPAIVYRLSDIQVREANNHKYKKAKCYEVILIDKNPDSIFVDKLEDLPYSSFSRHYVTDNLNHWVFQIYYFYEGDINHG